MLGAGLQGARCWSVREAVLTPGRGDWAASMPGLMASLRPGCGEGALEGGPGLQVDLGDPLIPGPHAVVGELVFGSESRL